MCMSSSRLTVYMWLLVYYVTIFIYDHVHFIYYIGTLPTIVGQLTALTYLSVGGSMTGMFR